jgi:flagellar hook-associated protein 1
LSSLIDVNVIDAGSGSLTLTTSNGTALVVADQPGLLGTQIDSATGYLHVFSQGTDITAALQGGRIAGLLQARDQSIPSILSDLDSLASSLANSFNSVHQAGFDLSGAQGGDFFMAPPASGVGAAASLAIAITDPARLAASLDGTPGDNSNLLAMADLQNQLIAGGQRPIDFYANLVSRIGNEVERTSIEQSGENLAMQQLENQRGAISGVSLDEEAANLLRFQRAFQAAARVVSIVDQLTEIAVNLGNG